MKTPYMITLLGRKMIFFKLSHQDRKDVASPKGQDSRAERRREWRTEQRFSSCFSVVLLLWTSGSGSRLGGYKKTCLPLFCTCDERTSNQEKLPRSVHTCVSPFPLYQLPILYLSCRRPGFLVNGCLAPNKCPRIFLEIVITQTYLSTPRH